MRRGTKCLTPPWYVLQPPPRSSLSKEAPVWQQFANHADPIRLETLVSATWCLGCCSVIITSWGWDICWWSDSPLCATFLSPDLFSCLLVLLIPNPSNISLFFPYSRRFSTTIFATSGRIIYVLLFGGQMDWWFSPFFAGLLCQLPGCLLPL